MRLNFALWIFNKTKFNDRKWKHFPSRRVATLIPCEQQQNRRVLISVPSRTKCSNNNLWHHVLSCSQLFSAVLWFCPLVLFSGSVDLWICHRFLQSMVLRRSDWDDEALLNLKATMELQLPSSICFTFRCSWSWFSLWLAAVLFCHWTINL